MSERQAENSSTHQDPDEIFLDETDFDTDPLQIVIESSDPSKLRYRLMEWVAEASNRKIKSERKNKAAETLKLSIRQVERLLKQYYDGELQEDPGVVRSDKGSHRVDEYWPNYSREVYEKSLKDKHPLKPADVVGEVQRHAVVDLGLEYGDYPHPATIYRVLKPLVEAQRRRKKVRNPGSGSWLTVETRDGESLKANFSNQIIQCDHTKLDIRIIDISGQTLQWRPWLTTVVDTFSSCLIGYHLWHKQPGDHEVGLALRHAILPKDYPEEYALRNTSDIYGPPLQYFFTDGGKDLSSSKSIKTLGLRLKFQCKLRRRPIHGGTVERLFGTINTKVLESLPGYQRNRAEKEDIKKAENEACLRLEDLDLILAPFFFDDYNHQPYSKYVCKYEGKILTEDEKDELKETRYERWFRGMGKRLPKPLDERELDLLLMKEDERIVQAHGSIDFNRITYRCKELKQLEGEYVAFRYDPDHILTLFAYKKSSGNQEGEFIGYAHAINMEMQDISLYELEQINKIRSSSKRDSSNYNALLALGERQKLVKQRKQEKKDCQQSEQKKLRTKNKGNSAVVEQREARKAGIKKTSRHTELSPDHAQVKPVNVSVPDSQSVEPPQPSPSMEDRHKLVISKNRNVRKLY